MDKVILRYITFGPGIPGAPCCPFRPFSASFPGIPGNPDMPGTPGSPCIIAETQHIYFITFKIPEPKKAAIIYLNH